MKKSLLAFLCLSIAAIAALAQQADKDGNINREAYMKFWQGQFDNLDCGEILDGKLSSSEWKNGLFLNYDKNADGFVDKGEWSAGRLADFDNSDVNHDGVLEPSEYNPQK